jgi:hypothetical protein
MSKANVACVAPGWSLWQNQLKSHDNLKYFNGFFSPYFYTVVLSASIAGFFSSCFHSPQLTDGFLL